MVDVGFKFPTSIACLGLVTTTMLSYACLELLVPRHQRQPVSMRYYFSR